MVFADLVSVKDLAGQLGVSAADILAAGRKQGMGVAAPDSLLNPRECDRLAKALGLAYRPPTSRRPPSSSSRSASSAPRSSSKPPVSRRHPIPSRAPVARSDVARRKRTPGQDGPGQKRAVRPDLATWTRLERAYESGADVTGLVTSLVKGGLVVDIGVRAFLPGSLVDVVRIPDLADFVGKSVTTKIIEFSREPATVVLSRRVVVEEHRQRQAEELLRSLSPGQARDATVETVRHNGLSVDLGGISVWIPIEEVPDEDRSNLIASFPPGQSIVVTICDVADSKIIASLRKPDVEEGESDNPVAELIADISAGEGEGALALLKGVPTIDLSNREGTHIEEVMQAGINQALSHSVSELLVATPNNLKREVRALIGSGRLRGLDPARCRQTSHGFILALRLDNGGTTA